MKSEGKTANPYHEGKACHAVVRFLETHNGMKGGEFRSPEDEGHHAPVDLTCLMDGHLFAFEHTGIESFDGQIELDMHANEFFMPIEKALANSLPQSEQFVLYVPVTATQELRRLKPKQKRQVQNAIIAWVCEVATALPVNDEPIPSQPPMWVPGVPFPLLLCRSLKVANSEDAFWRVPVVAIDLTTARADRIERACTKKVGKLGEWKQDSNARTILILESTEGPIQWIVAKSVLRIFKERENRPDEIYLVMTGRSAWWVSPILIDNTSIYDLNQPDQWTWRIDPASLASLTGR